MPYVIKTRSVDPDARAHANAASTTAVVLTIAVLAVIFALVYFMWWVPANPSAPTVIERNNTVIDRSTPAPNPTTTIVTPAPQPPVVIERTREVPVDRIREVPVPVPVPTPQQNTTGGDTP